MSKSSQDEGDSSPQDAPSGGSPKKDANASIYENRGGVKKIIRVITVMAYMFSVSFVAILLSSYYVFLWQPPNPKLMQREASKNGPRAQSLIDERSSETLSSESTMMKRPDGEVVDLKVFNSEFLRDWRTDDGPAESVQAQLRDSTNFSKIDLTEGSSIKYSKGRKEVLDRENEETRKAKNISKEIANAADRSSENSFDYVNIDSLVFGNDINRTDARKRYDDFGKVQTELKTSRLMEVPRGFKVDKVESISNNSTVLAHRLSRNDGENSWKNGTTIDHFVTPSANRDDFDGSTTSVLQRAFIKYRKTKALTDTTTLESNEKGKYAGDHPVKLKNVSKSTDNNYYNRNETPRQAIDPDGMSVKVEENEKRNKTNVHRQPSNSTNVNVAHDYSFNKSKENASSLQALHDNNSEPLQDISATASKNRRKPNLEPKGGHVLHRPIVHHRSSTSQSELHEQSNDSFPRKENDPTNFRETRFDGITIKSSEIQTELSEELNQSQLPRRKSFLTILKESTALDETTVAPSSSIIYTTRYPDLEKSLLNKIQSNTSKMLSKVTKSSNLF